MEEMEKDAKKESPILMQLEKNTKSLTNLGNSVAILEARLSTVLLPPPAQDEESKSESKEESKVLRSLLIQNGIVCSINDRIRELIDRLEL